MILRTLCIGCLLVSGLTTAQELDSLDLKIGQMILIGLDDFNRIEDATDQLDAIERGLAGGIILYEKHVRGERPRESMSRIIDSLQQLAPIPLFVSIDEEGGRVNRLKKKYGFHSTKSAQSLGDEGVLDSTYQAALRTARLLNELGINMNFAPVVDLNVNPNNPVIGRLGRSFSADYEQTTRHAYEVSRAHMGEQVIPVLKHFPGHGSSSTDTHLGLTDVSNSWVFDEVKPYFLLIGHNQVDAVMTAHIINERLDEARIPATLSKEIIHGILREIMKYDGVVISDDMQMHAISEHYGKEEAMVMCINAGVDILLFANNTTLANRIEVEDLHAVVKRNVLNGAISMKRINESYQRILDLKRKYNLLPGS